jgi:hypothetical protein
VDRTYEFLAEARRADARYDLAERRARWGGYREGPGSPLIAAIGRGAGAVRWLAARVVGLASGPGEVAATPPAAPVPPRRQSGNAR